MEDYKPKQIPMKCPVCGGRGRVNWDKEECHGCLGKGFILVDVAGGENNGKQNPKQ